MSRSAGEQRRVVVAFDKFRGSATASELVHAVAGVAEQSGWIADPQPLADGGEGSLAVVGGANKTTRVTDALGDPVQASWRMHQGTAFIEMAEVAGLELVGGREENDPIAADTTGVGELISTAVELGARTVYVLLGGSATTDGGLGAVRAMPPAPRLKEIDLVVASDVRTTFVDAAAVFGPQKGATPAQVELLTRRLERLVQVYRERYGVDVSAVEGAGAAGGLAGGLLAIGARLEPGFDVLAEETRLDERLAEADLVITGEGLLDEESFNGKVVGGVASWAAAEGVPVVAIVGAVDHGVEPPAGVEVISLSERFGLEASMNAAVDLAADVAAEVLESRN